MKASATPNGHHDRLQSADRCQAHRQGSSGTFVGRRGHAFKPSPRLKNRLPARAVTDNPRAIQSQMLAVVVAGLAEARLTGSSAVPEIDIVRTLSVIFDAQGKTTVMARPRKRKAQGSFDDRQWLDHKESLWQQLSESRLTNIEKRLNPKRMLSALVDAKSYGSVHSHFAARPQSPVAIGSVLVLRPCGKLLQPRRNGRPGRAWRPLPVPGRPCAGVPLPEDSFCSARQFRLDIDAGCANSDWSHCAP